MWRFKFAILLINNTAALTLRVHDADLRDRAHISTDQAVALTSWLVQISQLIQVLVESRLPLLLRLLAGIPGHRMLRCLSAHHAFFPDFLKSSLLNLKLLISMEYVTLKMQKKLEVNILT